MLLEIIRELNNTSTRLLGIKADGLAGNIGVWGFLTVLVYVLGVEGLKLLVR